MAELVSIKRNVDVSPGQAAPAVFHCSQGDVGSKIILGLLNNGTAYAIPSGVTVTIEGSESNGSIFTPISATVSGSDITFYLTGEMTAVAGPAICQAVLKSGSNILGTANFTLEVESSPMGADAPPVFTDAGWTWMLNKLTTEFVPALGDNIIDAIESKADQTDLTALSNTVAGHTGSIAVLNNSIGTINDSIVENRNNIASKLDKNQGTANAGKYLKVGADGNVKNAELDVTTDKTLSIADKAADAKAVGDELTDLKADLSQINCMNYMTFTNEQKSAILDAFRHVAWSGTDGQEYIDAMEAAFDTTPSIKSLTAVSDGTTIPVNATMAEVKETLTVTAVTSDDASIIVPDSAYNLTGTLTIGSCTLTISYGGLTATVTVTVGKPSLPDGYTGYSYIKHSSNAPSTGGSQLGIHTDVALKSEYTIDVDIKYPSYSASIICVCGTKSSKNAKEFGLFVTPSTGKLGYWYGETDTTNVFTPLIRDVNNHITVQPVGASETYPEYATLKVNDTDYSTGSTASGKDWSPWFGILSYAISATDIREQSVYNVGLQVGDIVVKDGDGDYVYYLTPASDGTYYGFYDLINDKFYYNETYATNFEGVV